MIQFEGGYDAFMAYRAREERPAARGEGTESAGPRDDRLEAKRLERRLERSARDQSVRIAALESRITELERSLEEHNAAITRAGEAQDVARVQQLGSVYQALQAELADTLEEWETAAGELL